MKRPLLNLFFIVAVILMAQLSFGQLVNVPLSNATGGTPHYSEPGKRDNPNYLINDSFTYNINSPTSPYPNCDPSGLDNYFLPAGTPEDNWWQCEMAIPAGKALKFLDFYVRDGNYSNSGAYNRFRNLKFTLSDGLLSETKYWEAISTTLANDGDVKNYRRWNIASAGFSESMLKNAVSLRIDHSSDNVDTFLEIQEIRLVAEASALSIENTKNIKLTVTPNPLETGNVTIRLNNVSTNILEVYSILGTLVFNQAIHSRQKVTLARNVFPSSGIYIIKVGEANLKLIVK